MNLIDMFDTLRFRFKIRFLFFKYMTPVLFVFGIIYLIYGLSPLEIKIETNNDIVTAQITKKVLFFHGNTIKLDNIQQAIKTYVGFRRYSSNYALVLEYDNGQKYNVTPISYDSDEILLPQINNVIKEKSNYTFIVRNKDSLFVGFFITIISGIFVFFFIASYFRNKNKQGKV